MKLIWLIIPLFIIPIAYAQENLLLIETKNAIKPNETLVVNVSLNLTQPAMGIQFDFYYDAMQALAIENGGLFEYWANDIYDNFTIIDNENGTIYNIVAFSDEPIYENGTVARIFLIGNQEGIVNLNIGNVVLSDENGNKLNVTILNKSIYIDGSKPSISLIIYPDKTTQEKNISFSWTALDNFSPNITFSYMLYGYENNWSSWSSINETHYDNLATGQYAFMLKAKDEAGNIAWLNYSFNITETNPPSILNVLANPIVQQVNGFVNITCNIVDESNIEEAKVIIEYPDESVYEFNLNKNEKYYFNQSYSIAGIYHFHIYARDEYGNENESAISQFEIVEDNIPPEIKDVMASPSLQNAGNNVTISCKVTDNIAIQDVFLNITYPDNSYHNFSIKNNKTDSIYYCNKAYDMLGTYHFFIYAIDTHGNSNKSSTYSFEIKNNPPVKPYNPWPNDEINIPLSITLKWSCEDPNEDDITYDIYFGTTLTKIASNITTNYFFISDLNFLTPYYWRVVAWDEHGARNASQIWHFTTRGNTAPVAIDDFIVMDQNSTCTIDVLENDHDAEGDTLTIISVGKPAYGNVTIKGGKIIYIPNEGYYGGDAFSYTISDGFTTASANVHITVNAIPKASFFFTPENPSPYSKIKFYSSSYDIDGYIANYTWYFGDGSIAYGKNVTHAYEKEGKYEVKLVVKDDKNATNECKIEINITKPDLILKDILYPSKIKKGEKFVLTIVVKNEGGYIGNVELKLYLNNESLDSKIFNISSDEEKINFSLKLNKNGEIKAVIDPDNEIEEKNEENNEKVIMLKISVASFNYYYLLPLLLLAIVPAYYMLKKEKKVVEAKEEERCIVCLGKFKEGAKVVRCKCGAIFHGSCANRIKECPNCGRKVG